MADVLYKFGYTTDDDAEARFKVYHNKFKFSKVNLADDYELKCYWSAWVSEERAKQMEKEWAARYPFNLDLVNGDLTKYNGITECRTFTEEQYTVIRKVYYDCADKKKSSYRKSDGQPVTHKVYIMKFIKK